MDERCEACTADAFIYHCDEEVSMFMCPHHFYLWMNEYKAKVMEDVSRRHDQRLRRREAKLSG